MNANVTDHRMGDGTAGATGGEQLRPGYVRPITSPVIRTSRIHFDVSPTLPEVVAFAVARGWPARGYSNVLIAWLDLHWTHDGWQTVNRLSSADVPCPITNGWFSLPVPSGAEVEFALHVGLQCRAPEDTAGCRDTGELWFNNAGANYRQTTT